MEMNQDGICPSPHVDMQNFVTPSHDTVSRRLSHDPVAGQRSLGGGDVRQRRVASCNETTFSSTILDSMPSRQRSQRRGASARNRSHKRSADVATIRLRHGENLDVTDLAERFVCDPVYTDQPDGLQSRQLKQLPRNIGYKLAVRQQIKESRTLGRNVRRPGWFKMLGYNISLAWKRFNENRAEIGYSLELWRSSIKKIEGHFGTGVTSYFLFIKWLFLLNLCTSLLLIVFIVMPRMLHRWLQQEPRGYDGQNVTFTGVELLTGGGWFTYTELYYGDYRNAIINIVDGLPYDMRYAYVCTIGAFYLVTVISLAYSLSKSYKENCINVSGGVHFYYTLKVLASWDYTVVEPKAVNLKQKGIFTELQEYLSELRSHTNDVPYSYTSWCTMLLIRCAINCLLLLLLTGSAYLIWYISISQSLQNDVVFLREMALPVCFTAINFILPFVFSVLTTLENYHNPRVSLYLTMLRTIILNVVTLGVLVYFWFESVDCHKQGIDMSLSPAECSMCWENFMGQQLYRLVILDFIFIILSTLLSEFGRRLLSQFCFKSLSRPEFNIGRNTLNLIYSQVLVWLGVFYSPLMSFIMVIKLLLILYVKRVSVLHNCVPSVKCWRGGRTHTAILGFLFAAFILCFVAVSYSVAFLHPSMDCGIYSGYNTSYAVLSEGLKGWRRQNKDLLSNILVDIFTSTASIIAVFVLLCVIAYYTRRAAQQQKQMVSLLLNQIALEGKEKLFLLRISERIHAGTSVDPRYVPKDKLTPNIPRQTMVQHVQESGDSPRAQLTTTPMLSPIPSQSPQRERRTRNRHTSPHTPNTDNMPSTPVRTLTGRGSPRAPVTLQLLNEGYAPRSLEHEDTPQLTSPPLQAENRSYRDHSPNSKPNLPYSAQMYTRKDV